MSKYVKKGDMQAYVLEKCANCDYAERTKDLEGQVRTLSATVNAANKEILSLKMGQSYLQRKCNRMESTISKKLGADPEHLKTKERDAWKQPIVDRVLLIREEYIRRNPDDLSMRYEDNKIFGTLYKQVKAVYGLDIRRRKLLYVKENKINQEAAEWVSLINVVYFYPDLREAFEKIVEVTEKEYGIGEAK